MKISYKILISCLALLLIPGCISNIFREPKPTFSAEVLLPELNPEFQQLTDNVYPAWKNKNTGNVISIISDCNEGHFTLKSIHSLMSDSLDTMKVIEEKLAIVNTRKSYYKKIQGSIEDKPIEIQSYSFQYRKCSYVASLAGKPDKVSQNLAEFKSFIQKIDFKK